jgi:hypothetical protein
MRATLVMPAPDFAGYCGPRVGATEPHAGDPDPQPPGAEHAEIAPPRIDRAGVPGAKSAKNGMRSSPHARKEDIHGQ